MAEPPSSLLKKPEEFEAWAGLQLVFLTFFNECYNYALINMFSTAVENRSPVAKQLYYFADRLSERLSLRSEDADEGIRGFVREHLELLFGSENDLTVRELESYSIFYLIKQLPRGWPIKILTDIRDARLANKEERRRLIAAELALMNAEPALRKTNYSWKTEHNWEPLLKSIRALHDNAEALALQIYREFVVVYDPSFTGQDVATAFHKYAADMVLLLAQMADTNNEDSMKLQVSIRNDIASEFVTLAAKLGDNIYPDVASRAVHVQAEPLDLGLREERVRKFDAAENAELARAEEINLRALRAQEDERAIQETLQDLRRMKEAEEKAQFQRTSIGSRARANDIHRRATVTAATTSWRKAKRDKTLEKN